jgi:hypothetical protein
MASNVPWACQHPNQAFAVSKMICWDYGYILGPSTNGSPVAKDQEKWLSYMITGEASARQRAGLPGNPAATLEGLKMQPKLAHLSTAFNAINPVEIYYQEQLSKYTARALYGQMSPQAALAQVQRLVVAQQQRLKAQYGAWNW